MTPPLGPWPITNGCLHWPRALASVGLTLAGISGWGGAALVSGPGDVVQAASATADSTIAVAGQPRLRFPIGHLSSTSVHSLRGQIRQACGQTDPRVTVAWLTRRQSGRQSPDPAARSRQLWCPDRARARRI